MNRLECADSIPQLLQDQAGRAPNDPALFPHPRPPSGQPVSWLELWNAVRNAAIRMQALGLRPGDRLAILSGTRLEWTMAEYAGLLAGAVIVGVDAHATSEQIAHVLRHSEARAVIVDTDASLAKVPSDILSRSLFIAQIDLPAGSPPPTPVIAWNELLAPAPTDSAPAPVLPLPGTTATLIYTSGTTGAPKAIEFTHGQLMAASRAILDLFPRLGGKDRIACWLPMSHLFQRMLNLVAIAVGAQIHFVGDPRQIMASLQAIEPSVFAGVPRFFEKVHEGVQQRLSRIPRPLRAPLSRLLRGRFRRLFGRNIRFLVTGSAPCPRPVLDFFAEIGVPLFEAYGISENAIPMAANRFDACRSGSVGIPLPQNEIRMAPDGEILVRGPGVFRGYYKDPDPSSSFTPDGFYRTGDFGFMDREGFLFIKGRKSDLIKTSTGRRIAPARLESLFRQSPFIEHAVVVGNGRKALSVLLTLNWKAVEALVPTSLRSSPHAQWLQAPEVYATLCQEIDRLNADLATFEQVQSFAVLPDSFSIGGGELTATLKVKRRTVEEKYGSLIDTIYEKAG